MIKFNALTGEDYCEWFVSDVCDSVVPGGTEVAFDIKQVGFTVSSLFFPRPASCSRQFTPNGSNFAQHFTAAEYTEKKKMISWSRTWSLSWHLHSRIGKIAHIRPSKKNHMFLVPARFIF